MTEVEEQRKVLAIEHSHLDENDEAKIVDGNYDIKDKDAFDKDFAELYAEELIIDGGDAHGMLKTVKSVLDNSDVAFSGQEAAIYDYLCDQFEGEGEEWWIYKYQT